MQHWERSTVDASITGGNSISVDTKNVAAFSIDMARSPFDISKPVTVTVNGRAIQTGGSQTDRSFHWSSDTAAPATLAKVHNLQGPIDDAFLGRFIFVRPTAAEPSAWAKSEMHRAISEWRRVFRGEPIVKDDTAITASDVASASLVLWGDPQSNAVYGRIAARLPLAYPDDKRQSLIMIYPNPENPSRYVVINSGFTFRESANTSNARQLPVLPDWAIVDTSRPPGDHWPGRIVKAGFFNEQWK
jgi:hypothetical protein